MRKNHKKKSTNHNYIKDEFKKALKQLKSQIFDAV
jgi:hypothetical protein